MAYYYTKEINKAIPITDVLKMYGKDARTRTNVHCPSPDHQDIKPSARIYTDSNTCKCYSCGKVFTPINIVMQEEGWNLPKTCEYLCEQFGLSKSEYSDRDETYSKQLDGFNFTYDEMQLIELGKGWVSTEYLVYGEPDEPIEDAQKDWCDYTKKEKTPSLRDLYNLDSEFCDREFLKELIQAKAMDKKLTLIESKKLFEESIDNFEKRDDFAEVLGLYARYEKLKKANLDLWFCVGRPEGVKDNKGYEKLIPSNMDKNEYVQKIVLAKDYYDNMDFINKIDCYIRICDKIYEKAEKIEVKKNLTQMQSFGKKDIDKDKKEKRGLNKCF